MMFVISNLEEKLIIINGNFYNKTGRTYSRGFHLWLFLVAKALLEIKLKIKKKPMHSITVPR